MVKYRNHIIYYNIYVHCRLTIVLFLNSPYESELVVVLSHMYSTLIAYLNHHT